MNRRKLFPNKVIAPFTDDEVAALNRWQASDAVHPFTCPNNHAGDRVLIARRDGWHCPKCVYLQTWAHRMMLVLPP